MARLRRPRYADVTATLALVIAVSTGGAYAAGALVGTSQIANGAVTAPKLATNAVIASKIATNAVTASKIATNAVTASKIASAAVTSSKLANAVRVDIVPPWGVIPSHETVTGRFIGVGIQGTQATFHFESINLPAAAPVALTQPMMGFGTTVGGIARDTRCAGTLANPTAPAGMVCVYLHTANGFSGIHVHPWPDASQAKNAFDIQFQIPVGGVVWGEYGVWAYTAP